MQKYIGRFAPSPTGPLHLGSLIAAVASYLDAKKNNGKWLVRIEDIDPPREQVGASKAITESLKNHGLNPDDDILYQSHRSALYQSTLQSLLAENLLFPCRCSRQSLQKCNGIHSGRCEPEPSNRQDSATPNLETDNWAWRLCAANKVIQFEDIIQGPVKQSLAMEVGDVVLRRRDKLFAYQLAVVCDDIDQNITHVVRGTDLLDSTARQIYLYECLNHKAPVFAHLPILLQANGQKLSKQNHAPKLDPETANLNLWRCLNWLGMNPPNKLKTENCQSILQWGTRYWNINTVPTQIKQTL